MKPREISDRQERRIARMVGGRRTPNSGAGWDKGDVKAPGARLECKSTSKLQFPLKRRELEKIEGEALGDEIPVLAVEFRDPVVPGRKSQYMVVPEGWFNYLLDLHRRNL
jgi:hypothetical protein